MLSAIKDMHGSQWFKHVSYIGDMTDMKVMTYNDTKFADLMLMTSGGSLKQFCKDLKIDMSCGKKDIDMNKMKTFESAVLNRDEIMEYVMYDSKAIHAIHKIFERSIRMVVQDYGDTQPTNVACRHHFDQHSEKMDKIAQSSRSVYSLIKGFNT